ncbi:hypothetical protein E0H73_02660 [Kribbella pittospori]|uniref:DUF3558 domain-containing protein n=1 Tax=Kribbella pittospori TaxID=722689 RepID=A0A4R0KYS9_9ACTN|nr:hypothetical protein [Kribbella pittospori]TCC65850.1 hypothetical protein E0H73_02660 [Kribbella pittospori]
MRTVAAVTGSLLVLVLALSGCGNSDETAKGTPSANVEDKSAGAAACKLLTPGGLEQQFGVSFGDGVPSHQEETGSDQCVWTSSGGVSTTTFSLTVLRQDGLRGDLKSSGMTLAQLFQQTKGAYPKAKAIDLGDQAYIAAREVQVLAGDTWYSFSFHGPDDTGVDGLKAVAAQVVG